MKASELDRLLPASSKAALSAIFDGEGDNGARGERAEKRTLLLRTAASHLTKDEADLLDAFFTAPAFAAYMRARMRISEKRFEETTAKLFRRLASGMAPAVIAAIAGAMSRETYRSIERSFFKVPVDTEGFDLFENGFIRVGEQNLDLLEEYCLFYASAEYSFLRGAYRGEGKLYEEILSRLTDILLASGISAKVRDCAWRLSQDYLSVFVHISKDMEKSDEFLPHLFKVFSTLRDNGIFFDFVKALYVRYRPQLDRRDGSGNTVFFRLINVWDMAVDAKAETLSLFRQFLKRYGNTRNDFESFIWGVVFGLAPDRSVKALEILVSQAFDSLQGYYCNDAPTIKLLVKNIIAAVTEMEIRGLANPLYQVVLRLILGLKLNRGFIKRRGDFHSWLKKQTGSLRVEMELIRYMFFEYLFISLGFVTGDRDHRLTKFCDEGHRDFCAVIDAMPRRRGASKPEEDYAKILEMMRNTLWAPLYRRFPANEYGVTQLKSIAESADHEDGVLQALEKVEPENFARYSGSLMEAFRREPDLLDEAVRPDYWFRVNFPEAMPYCYGVMIPLIGTIRLEESEGQLARTDGKSIFLPRYINFFKDPLDPLIDNRNLAAYIAITLHEMGHILGGSYHFNILNYLNKLERPELFKEIWNCFEDYRIEAFMVKIEAHHQVHELFTIMNRVLSARLAVADLPLASRLLIYMVDRAAGYDEDIRELAEYRAKLDTLFARMANTGRFPDIRAMAEYGIERLKNIEIGNPVGVYPLAREFYEIMKHWNDADLVAVYPKRVVYQWVVDPEGMEGDSCGGCPPSSGRALSRDELDAMYREYNEDPERFLRSNGLPVFTAVLPGGGDGKGDRPRCRRKDAGADRESFMDEMLTAGADIDYGHSGTVDDSTRTKVDDGFAERQMKGKGGRKVVGKKKGKRADRKYVYSIDPMTKSRTRLSEIVEYPVRGTDRAFMKKFGKWEYLGSVVHQMLARILPALEDEHDTSRFEGDIDLELLVEVLSDRRNVQESPEMFDILRETRRSLEVVIGLDISGSTAATIDETKGQSDIDMIIDVEKAFAIIFGRAMGFLTDRVAIYAFNSATSTNVYRAEGIDSVSMFAADGGNRDGDFIRYVADVLSKSDAEERYFFLLSDGQPNSDNYFGKEALDDTLIAMRETVNSGIKLIYFNFDSFKGEYFSLFQKESTFARYFKSPADILAVIPDMVASVATSIR